MMQRNCPNCGKDITQNQFEQDSVEVHGFIDIGYDCEDCKLSIYTFKVVKLQEDDEDAV